MAGVLDIAVKVLTGDELARRHGDQTALRLGPGTVVTPTAWDYIRRHRLVLERDGAEAAPQEETPVAQEVPPEGGAAQADQARQVHPGRCDHPTRSYGCQTEEFGSGFAQPTSCGDCPIHALKRQGVAGCSCQGCNRHEAVQEQVRQGQVPDIEELVQRITDQIIGRVS